MRAAIVETVQLRNVRKTDQEQFWLECMSDLAAQLLAGAGMHKDEVDGLFVPPVPELPTGAPAGVAQYLGLNVRLADVVDMGGGTATAAVLRAAMAIEAGACETCLLLFPNPKRPTQEDAGRKLAHPIYAAGGAWGAWQSLHEYPSGLVGAVANFAMLSRQYLSRYNVGEEDLAAIAAVSRRNGQGNPVAVFGAQPMTVEEVMSAPRICDPIKLPEAVIPCFGGSGIVMTSDRRARQLFSRPVLVTGYGEKLNRSTMQYAKDALKTPLDAAAKAALERAGVTHKSFDFAGIYDCFTVNVALSLENAGFCAPGRGAELFTSGAAAHDGAFPINPNGGMLAQGQAGYGGGASHVTDSVRQIQRRANGVQLAKADRAFVAGTGGMMAEQIALVLEGA